MRAGKGVGKGVGGRRGREERGGMKMGKGYYKPLDNSGLGGWVRDWLWSVEEGELGVTQMSWSESLKTSITSSKEAK